MASPLKGDVNIKFPAIFNIIENEHLIPYNQPEQLIERKGRSFSRREFLRGISASAIALWVGLAAKRLRAESPEVSSGATVELLNNPDLFRNLFIENESSIQNYLTKRLHTLQDLIFSYQQQKIRYVEAYASRSKTRNDEFEARLKVEAEQLLNMQQTLFKFVESDFKIDYNKVHLALDFKHAVLSRLKAGTDEDSKILYTGYVTKMNAVLDRLQHLVRYSKRISILRSPSTALDRRSFITFAKLGEQRILNDNIVTELEEKMVKEFESINKDVSEEFANIIARLVEENKKLIQRGKKLAEEVPRRAVGNPLFSMLTDWLRIRSKFFQGGDGTVFEVREGDAIIHLFAQLLGMSKTDVQEAINTRVLPGSAQPNETLIVPSGLGANDPNRLLAEVPHDAIQQDGSEWELFMNNKMLDVYRAMSQIVENNLTRAKKRRSYFKDLDGKNRFKEYLDALTSIAGLIKKLGVDISVSKRLGGGFDESVIQRYMFDVAARTVSVSPDRLTVDLKSGYPLLELQKRVAENARVDSSAVSDSSSNMSPPRNPFEHVNEVGNATKSKVIDYRLVSKVFQGKQQVLRAINEQVTVVNDIGKLANEWWSEREDKKPDEPDKLWLRLFSFGQVKQIEDEARSREWIKTRSECRMPKEIYERFMAMKMDLLRKGYYLFPTETDSSAHQSIGHYELNIVDMKATNIRRVKVGQSYVFVHSLITAEESKSLEAIILKEAILENAWKPEYGETLKKVKDRLMQLRGSTSEKTMQARIESWVKQSYDLRRKTSIYKVAVLNEYTNDSDLKTGGHLHIAFLPQDRDDL